MAQQTESEAVFRERVSNLGLDDFLSIFLQKGWTTYGAFAFSTSSPPCPADSNQITDQIIAPVLGEEGQDHQLAPSFRRLHWGSTLLAIGEMKQRVERTGDEPQRRLPHAERRVRRTRLETRLVGLRLEGYGEPSFSLVDLFVDAFDTNQLSYMPWSACTPRSLEIELKVEKKSWAPDSSGVIRERSSDIEPSINVNAALALDHALLRRGLAAELGGVISFEGHECFDADSSARSSRRPPTRGTPRRRWSRSQRPTSGSSRSSHVRLVRAFVPPQASFLPLAKAMDVALGCPELALLLMPLPITNVMRTAEDGPSPQCHSLASERRRRLAPRLLPHHPLRSALGQHGGDEKQREGQRQARPEHASAARWPGRGPR